MTSEELMEALAQELQTIARMREQQQAQMQETLALRESIADLRNSIADL